MKFKDKNGREFIENDVVKVLHYTDRKGDPVYMYKWIRIRHDGVLCFLHQSVPKERLVPLVAVCNEEGVWEDAEILHNSRGRL